MSSNLGAYTSEQEKQEKQPIGDLENKCCWVGFILQVGHHNPQDISDAGTILANTAPLRHGRNAEV